MDNYLLIKRADFETLYDHLCRSLTEWEENPNGFLLYLAMTDLQRMFNNMETE